MNSGHSRRSCRLFVFLILAGSLLAGPMWARAGGGGESVALIVNADSWSSMTIANEYVRLRHIPATNIVYLHLGELADFAAIDVNGFRAKILEPVLSVLKDRDLTGQIDYIIYSSDIPYEISIASDLGSVKLPYLNNPSVSITGLTYLFRQVLAKDLGYLALNANRYVRPPSLGANGGATVSAALPAASAPAAGSMDTQASMGFRSVYKWDANGRLDSYGVGSSYLLSTMLAWTSGRGNSVNEALECLRRSAAADGTRPVGTVYMVRCNDVRSRTRENMFTPALGQLRDLGVAGEVFDAKNTYDMPVGKADVLGLMGGTAEYNFKASGSKILPGAICENLTSFAGIFREESGQTPMSEWIRCGASGTAGTVSEPFAIASKFPTPFVHAHYMRGCSLAEAMYQSVAAPFQLLVLGDGLCQPFARIPQLAIEGIKDGDVVKGKVTIKAALKDPTARVQWDMYVDGVIAAGNWAGELVTFNSPDFGDGYHEVRLVVTGKDAIGTQGRAIYKVFVNNRKSTATASLAGGEKVSWGQSVRIDAAVAGARSLCVFHNGRRVATVAGEKGQLTVDTSKLGMGEIELVVAGIMGATPDSSPRIACMPLRVTVGPPAMLAPVAMEPNMKLANGPTLISSRGKSLVATTKGGDWAARGGLREGQAFILDGYYEAPDDDLYQFQVNFDGKYDIQVDGQALVAQVSEGEKGWQSLPVNLKAGLHRIVVRALPLHQPLMDIRFGNRGTRWVNEKTFKHLEPAK